MSFFAELKRRNVFRVAIAYLAAAWLLTEVAGTLFPVFGVPEWGVRFMVILFALGFLPALIFSWVYELTPEGLKRERDVVRDDSITHVTARRLDGITIGMVLVALAVLAVDRLWLDSRDIPSGVVPRATDSEGPAPASGEAWTADEAGPSIAVLPFANRSAKAEDAFFVDGIHDDLLTYISQIGSIKTISRTSVMQYRDTTKPIRQIAGELQVQTVLEGGVQRSGDQVRINVQLIDAQTDDHLWAQIYDRHLTAANLFAIQSEIAREIAAALRATLSPATEQRIEQVPTESLPALEAYFVGRQSMATRTVPDLARAAERFEQAVTYDPDFALAWVGLADTYLLQAGYAGLPWDEMLPRSESAAERALQLDPGLGEAYASLAKKRNWAGDMQGAEAAFRKALELNPNYAPTYQWYAEMLRRLSGRTTEALELARTAVTLDPKSAIIVNDYAEVLESAGRFDEALAHYRLAIEIEPGFAHGHDNVGWLKALAWGRLDEAIAAFGQGWAIEPESPGHAASIAWAYLSLGDLDQAQSWLERAREVVPEDSPLDYFVGRASIGLHLSRTEGDLAMDLVRRGLAANPRDPLALRQLGHHEVRTGETSGIRSRYEQMYPGLFHEDPGVDRGNYKAAIGLASVLLKSGEADRAQQLLDRSLSFMKTIPRMGSFGFGPYDAVALALRGDLEESLAALRQAVDAGWRLDWWYYLEQDPDLEPLRGDARFQALQREIEADMASQLARVREWESAGRLAPPSTEKGDGAN
jgi:TolB-like protein/Tfp pilus assembly protein PilF